MNGKPKKNDQFKKVAAGMKFIRLLDQKEVDIEKIREVMKSESFEPNFCNNLPLRLASSRGNTKVVEALLDTNFVDCGDSRSITKADLWSIIGDKYKDANKYCGYDSALIEAIKNNHIEVFELLVRVNNTYLGALEKAWYLCFIRGKKEMARRLLYNTILYRKIVGDIDSYSHVHGFDRLFDSYTLKPPTYKPKAFEIDMEKMSKDRGTYPELPVTQETQHLAKMAMKDSIPGYKNTSSAAHSSDSAMQSALKALTYTNSKSKTYDSGSSTKTGAPDNLGITSSPRKDTQSSTVDFNIPLLGDGGNPDVPSKTRSSSKNVKVSHDKSSSASQKRKKKVSVKDTHESSADARNTAGEKMKEMEKKMKEVEKKMKEMEKKMDKIILLIAELNRNSKLVDNQGSDPGNSDKSNPGNSDKSNQGSKHGTGI